MKNDREYEAEILRSFENGEWQPVKNLKKEMARYRHAAAETLLKNKRVNIRISAIDLEGLHANAAEILRKIQLDQKPLIITQKGKATAVLQDLASFEQTQATLTMLKILALGEAQIAAGQTVLAKVAFEQIRKSARRPTA